MAHSHFFARLQLRWGYVQAYLHQTRVGHLSQPKTGAILCCADETDGICKWSCVFKHDSRRDRKNRPQFWKMMFRVESAGGWCFCNNMCFSQFLLMKRTIDWDWWMESFWMVLRWYTDAKEILFSIWVIRHSEKSGVRSLGHSIYRSRLSGVYTDKNVPGQASFGEVADHWTHNQKIIRLNPEWCK